MIKNWIRNIVAEMFEKIFMPEVDRKIEVDGYIDYHQLAEEIDYSDLSYEISYSDLSDYVCASDVADYIDTYDVANEMDIQSHVDDYLEQVDYAEYIDLDELANNLDMSEIEINYKGALEDLHAKIEDLLQTQMAIVNALKGVANSLD